MRILSLILVILFLSGCASVTQKPGILEAPKLHESPLKKQLAGIPTLDGQKITVAVYGFQDKTGQRKPADTYASFSSAVTQGAESWIIDSLRLAGKGTWFTVLDRSALDNVVKERQLIAQTREAFHGPKAQPLSPMLFAGLIVEGGIIGYDSNILTGGGGAALLGITGQTQYRKDVVTVSLRFVSVQTGEVVLSTAVTKTITSVALGTSFFKYFEHGVTPAEAEIGITANEPNTVAVRSAIDQAVIEIIREGETAGIWKYKKTQ